MLRGVLVVLFCVIAAVSAQTLCAKYNAALSLNNETALIETVVNGAIGSVTANTVTKRYFDGSLSPYQWKDAPAFTSASGADALVHLRGNLITFFYSALGCADGTSGSYTGRDMKTTHAPMPIGPVQFESFNRQVLAVLAGAGVTAEDQLTILGVLNGLKGDICNQPACNAVTATASICDRYGSALNLTSYDLMDTVVGGVIGNVTSANSPLKKYFDGSISGTTNFLDASNAGALAALRAHLDQFFGMSGVLGCTGTFPAYGGRSLKDSHAQLQIPPSAFNLFNQVVVDTMTTAGVTAADTTAVMSVLQSTKADIVTVNDPTGTTGTSGASTVIVSSVAVAFAVAYLL